jgi:hypothetical protein
VTALRYQTILLRREKLGLRRSLIVATPPDQLSAKA